MSPRHNYPPPPAARRSVGERRTGHRPSPLPLRDGRRIHVPDPGGRVFPEADQLYPERPWRTLVRRLTRRRTTGRPRA